MTANVTPVIAVPGAQTLGVGQLTAISGVSLSESGTTSSETFTVTLSDSNGMLSATASGAAHGDRLGDDEPDHHRHAEPGEYATSAR